MNRIVDATQPERGARMNRLGSSQSKGRLIVLVGPPGSGKTEWALRNAAGAVVVSQDGLIDAISPSGFDPSLRLVYGAAEDAIARAGLAAGRVVIVDRTNRNRTLRARWISMAREAACDAIAVEMGTSEELCRERNRSRRGPQRVSEERMERMLAAMEAISPDEGFEAIVPAESFELPPSSGCASQSTEESYVNHDQARRQGSDGSRGPDPSFEK